jgi:hypothetical protein
VEAAAIGLVDLFRHPPSTVGRGEEPQRERPALQVHVTAGLPERLDEDQPVRVRPRTRGRRTPEAGADALSAELSQSQIEPVAVSDRPRSEDPSGEGQPVREPTREVVPREGDLDETLGDRGLIVRDPRSL